MLDTHSSVDRHAHPVVLGAGLTGLAISRALSSACITHTLVGNRPDDSPRLGESLNAEGSLEAARQFHDLASFFFEKRRQALFFGEHALAFDSLQFTAGPAYYRLLDLPPTVRLLHVDRIGFDRKLFDSAIASEHCSYTEGRAEAIDYDPASDRIQGVELADGQIVPSSFVFDATNHMCFVARHVGVRRHVLGSARRVVFAHYRAVEQPPAGATPGWLDTTSLLRLDSRTDRVDGLAWLIPLGEYVSVGVSVDPMMTGATPELLLDWITRAYEARGVALLHRFPRRTGFGDVRYEHYRHERCYGRNWLLAGTSCCQFWFPAATGVATGLVAARFAHDVLRAPGLAAPMYQAYVNDAATSHSGLEWLVTDDPSSVSADEVRRRAERIVTGNLERLSGYLGLKRTPPELVFGDALLRMFESNRELATPVHVDTAPGAAQGTRLFRPMPVKPEPAAPIEKAAVIPRRRTTARKRTRRPAP